ncbi:MAG: c-type cytochrome [Pirellulales bacterium]|nr:c-type cytochrome [Pirellulales bacterium]
MKSCFRQLIVLLAVVAWSAAAHAQRPEATRADGAAASVVVQAAEGFTVELAAGPPLTERPIVGAFDDEGRLYVAESSGSNDPVEQQLAERPHQVARLEDVDGDGRYDKRTVFADGMMFPEGAMWLDGSLYVSAPPSIWRLTDRDGDGLAEERVEWFQGKTLTGCANDLHGPYAGPDGWIYWCKGAFAEQTHQIHGRPWKSRAAHIFRCRADGSGLEPVMTGGMDNPVDVIFTPEGERIFSATFLEGDGRQDGIAHAPYGSVFGKEHGVLDGHPRTGELMPAIEYLDAAAPCGLERYDGQSFGEGYRNNLLLCEFNMRRVSRHVLQPVGSTFSGQSSPLVWSDHVDFHPTDVLVDADGSVLVLDTGGWYKLCCPTSQLWKPDVLGGIYRVRRAGAAAMDDPRGLKLAWEGATPGELWSRLGDARPAVRRRASRQFAAARNTPAMGDFLSELAAREPGALLSPAGKQTSTSAADARDAAMARAWALIQLETDAAQSIVRRLLGHPQQSVRHVALQGVSLFRDVQAAGAVRKILETDAAPCRRVAAEALGRFADRSAAAALLTAAEDAGDRALQHSITYALIELADAEATRAGLASDSPAAQAAALVALDQMVGGGVAPREVIPLLDAPDAGLKQAATWLVLRHPEWGADAAGWFEGRLTELAVKPQAARGEGVERASEGSSLESMLLAFVENPEVQALLARFAGDGGQDPAARAAALRVMAAARLSAAPASWPDALAAAIAEGRQELLPLAVEAARRLPGAVEGHAELQAALAAIAESGEQVIEVRAAALAAAAPKLPRLSPAQFDLVVAALATDTAVAARSAAVDAATLAPLDAAQLHRLCTMLKAVGPLELNRLLAAYAHPSDEALALELVASLKQSPALASLRLDLLRQTLATCGPEVQQAVAELEAAVNIDAAAQRARIDELLPRMAGGDVRRGHAVFHSSKASCSACHRMGYAGGSVGPELTRIGEIRSERDLLESILFPSLSFVRSYEPVVILTTGGQALNGAIRDESEGAIVLATGPNEEVRILREDVEEIQPSTVSVMPAGLDRQLSEQELADLVTFLKSAK